MWCSLCFECFLGISEQKATFALYVINWLVFITMVESVYCAVRTDSYIKQIAFSLERLREPLACLCSCMDYQYSLCFLLVQPMVTPLATFTEVPRLGSVQVSACEKPCLANWPAVSFLAIPICPGTHTSWILLRSPSFPSAEVKIEWSCTSNSTLCLRSMDRDFTLSHLYLLAHFMFCFSKLSLCVAGCSLMPHDWHLMRYLLLSVHLPHLVTRKSMACQGEFGFPYTEAASHLDIRYC